MLSIWGKGGGGGEEERGDEGGRKGGQREREKRWKWEERQIKVTSLTRRLTKHYRDQLCLMATQTTRV